MKREVVFLLMAGAVIALLAVSGCMEEREQAQVNLIYTRGTGPMPMMLATNQIDGYIAWQPFVEVGPVAGIGKVLVYSQDMPPKGRWTSHPCCVLTANNDMIQKSPELVDALGALTILATQYVREHPAEAADVVADWLAGKGNFTYGEVSVSSVEVMNRALPTIGFVNEPSEKWIAGNLDFLHALRDLGTIKGRLSNTTDNESRAILFNSGPYHRAMEMIANGTIPTPPKAERQLGIGYLMSDHHAALFVAVKKWDLFESSYNISLRPRDPAQTRPEIVDLYVNGEKVAEFRLVAGDAGPQLMQLSATDQIQFAFVGNPPAISAIDSKVPVSILMAVNTEGSGVVIAKDAPASDWTGFIRWAEERTQKNEPLRIAAPGKGSIQDVMIRYSLESSGVKVVEVS
ncbi:MAG: ABC transporter substrate-binding protein [Methanomicrobiales archaeon]|nr:ABC transporter substrate-binding protein [Methanomicrobiales archaeon]